MNLSSLLRTSIILIAAQSAAALSAEPFSLPDLPYAYDALEPQIDEMTMIIHHQRHHGAQVRGLNAAVAQFPELATLSLEQILRSVSRFNDFVRNNAGGHFNHTLFWQILAPAGTGGQPSAELLAAINRDFGSFQNFQSQLTKAANSQFGSGWAWLILLPDGNLAVTSTPNQDNPLMDIVQPNGVPILGIDVWEHAYYLSYQNRRGAYVSKWWDIINWHEVSRLFQQLTPQPADAAR